MIGQTDLLKIVDTLHTTRGLSGGLNGGQQQTNQDTDDGDHYQEFDECESV
jgi:hypothetical protein